MYRTLIVFYPKSSVRARERGELSSFRFRVLLAFTLVLFVVVVVAVAVVVVDWSVATFHLASGLSDNSNKMQRSTIGSKQETSRTLPDGLDVSLMLESMKVWQTDRSI